MNTIWPNQALDGEMQEIAASPASNNQVRFSEKPPMTMAEQAVGRCQRLWQPTRPWQRCRTVGIIEAVVYPFRGDMAGVQWSWPRVPALRLPADRKGAHWEALPG